MRRDRWKKQLAYCIAGALALGSAALAQDQSAQSAHQHGPVAQHRPSPNDLIRIVKEATARYQDVAVAEADGYQLMFGCVSGEDSGAMGLHYVKMPLVADPALNPAQPEIVIYEAVGNGRLRLIGADFLVTKEAWHTQNAAPPELLGQLLHLFESPNRFGLPDFYTLHVWAWKDNPNGAFVNWHPKVSCEKFNAEG